MASFFHRLKKTRHQEQEGYQEGCQEDYQEKYQQNDQRGYQEGNQKTIEVEDLDNEKPGYTETGMVTETANDLSRLLSNHSGAEYNAFEHEDEDNFPDGGFKAWLVVAGSSFGLMTVFGVMDTMSSIQLYIQSHILTDDKVSSISWIFSLYMFCNLSIGIVAGPLFDIYGIKKVLIPGMVLNCGGLYATAYSTKLWQFVLSFGIATGLGSGLMLTPLVGVVNHWFLKRRGLANGISECGSVSGIFFPIMLRSLFPKLGFQQTMDIVASICVFLCILCFICVSDRSHILHDKEILKRRGIWENVVEVLDFNSFKERRYALLVSAMFFSEFSIILTITYIATYVEVRDLGSSTAYIMVTVMNTTGIAGKLIPCYLSDYVGRFNMLVTVSVIMTISIFAVWLPYYNETGLYIFVCIYGFVFSAAYTMTPVALAQISQTRKFGSRYATAYFIVAFGNLVSMPIGSQFINVQTITNYNHMIIFAGCTCALGSILFISSRTAIVGWRLWKYV